MSTRIDTVTPLLIIIIVTILIKTIIFITVIILAYNHRSMIQAKAEFE